MESGPRVITLDRLSGCSLYVRVYSGLQMLAQASAFVVTNRGQNYLITNWHVVTGKHPETGVALFDETLRPNRLIVFHHSAASLQEWIPTEIAILSDQQVPIWFEHPNGKNVDVVAIPIATDPRIQIVDLDLSMADVDVKFGPGSTVSIIGYPLRIDGPPILPVWKTGHVAYEPHVDFEGKPLVLVDATGRPGMSGAPVVVRIYGTYVDSYGRNLMNSDGFVTRFLGVYSGNYAFQGVDRLELGRVWKPQVIRDILNLVKP